MRRELPLDDGQMDGDPDLCLSSPGEKMLTDERGGVIDAAIGKDGPKTASKMAGGICPTPPASYYDAAADSRHFDIGVASGVSNMRGFWEAINTRL